MYSSSSTGDNNVKDVEENGAGVQGSHVDDSGVQRKDQVVNVDKHHRERFGYRGREEEWRKMERN